MKVETAIQSAFQLGSKDILTEAAAVLRENIISAFENSNELRWPTTAYQIDNVGDVIPPSLSFFLRYIFSRTVKDL